MRTTTRPLDVIKRFPVTVLATTVFAVAASAGLSLSVEPDVPSAVARVVGVLLVAAGTFVAERSLGSIVTALYGSLLAAGATVTGVLLLQLAALTGENTAVLSIGEQHWAPSVWVVSVLALASSRMRPAHRTWVRVTILMTTSTLLLTLGHAADVVRMIAGVVGIISGAVAASEKQPLRWRSDRHIVRLVTASVIASLGIAALLVASSLPTDGPLAAAMGVLPSPVQIVLGTLLLGSALLIARGRSVGVLFGSGLLLADVVLLVSALLADDAGSWFQWSGADFGDVEWQVALIAGVALPALIAAAVIGMRRRLLAPGRAATTGFDARSEARRIAAQYGDSTFSHMVTWKGNDLWFGQDSVVAYRQHRGTAVTLAEPVGPQESRAAALQGFARFCDEQGWTPVFYSVHDDTAEMLRSIGWETIPVGVESIIDVPSFSLSGKKRQDLRTATNRAAREGVTARWTRFVDLDPSTATAVEQICSGWADDKALPEMGFTLGGFDELRDPSVQLMIAVTKTGIVQAVTSWLPTSGGGLVLDVMRRGPEPMPGVMEFLIAQTVLRAQEDGVATVSLSGTPLAPHDAASTNTTDVLAGKLARFLEPAYGFGSLRRFKEKFTPAHERLWMAVPSGFHLAGVSTALVHAYVPEFRLRDLRTLTARGAAA